MLQSPKKTSEPRVRLAVVDEAASQKDSKSSQLKQVACNSAVKKGYKKQHKRHLSAPEDMLMMSALRNLQPAPPRLPDGSIPQEGFNPTQLDMNMGMDANGMVKHEHRPLTPPNRRASSAYTCSTCLSMLIFFSVFSNDTPESVHAKHGRTRARA